MNKKLLSLLLLLLAAFTTATAQETLTVYDGTVSNGQVPAYLSYWDDFTRSQVVIPATDLTNMAGGTITSMTFYTTKQNLPYTSVSTADVYLMEVDYTAINDFEPKASATMVYQGTASFVLDETGEAGSWTIEFATPYIYGGGNLLIGIENTTDSGYKFIYFYGQTVEGASVAGYNSSSLDNVTATQKNFIPKTTFAYTPAGGVIVAKPTNLQVSNIGPNSATLSWTAGGEETAWDVEYKKAADEEWTQEAVTTTTLELDALENGTEYQVRVRANMGDGNVSGWVNTTFTTLLCDPEDMGEITYELKDSYGDGWSGNAIEIVAPNGLVVASLTITSGSTASGTVALCHGIEYTIRWKVGSYPSECSYTLTGPDGAEIVKGTGTTTSGTLATYMLPAPGQGMVKNVEVTDITATTANVNWEGEQETYNVRYRQHTVNLTPIDFRLHRYDIRAGLRWDYYNYYGQLLSATGNLPSVDNDAYISYFAKADLNTENDWYFPTRGNRFHAAYSYHTTNFYGFDNEIGLSDIMAHWRINLPLSDHWTLQPMLYGRLLLGGDSPLAFYNIVGGEWFGHTVEQQLPFAGIGNAETCQRHFAAIQMQMQCHLFKNHYLLLRVAGAYQTDDLAQLSTDGLNLGVQAGYSLSSIIGPVDARIGYSSHTRKPYFFINLGHIF